MAWNITRPDDEIDDVLNIAADQEEQGGTAYPGMTFEQGVAQGIEWACGASDDRPLP
jgi:hypothetical protein